jgi:CRISPR-associated protein Cas4
MTDPSTDDPIPELLPARMLNEFVYCPRLFHLEWVQGEWEESADTLSGSREHRRVDVEGGTLPGAEELAGEGFTARSVLLSAPGEGLTARLDVLEGRGGEVVPVDYKRGRAPTGPEPVWDADRVQLGAQALVLRENGYVCREAIVYYVASRRRVAIAVDDALVEWTRAQVRGAREVASSSTAPPPLVDSPKCPRCSLVGICLPDEQNRLAAPAGEDAPEVRRLYPARDDALPLYVQVQGARIAKRGEELEVVERDQGSRRVRLIDVSQLALYGNVEVSSSALRCVLSRGIPVCYFSYGGWFQGIAHGIGNRNCDLRLHQYRVASDAES